MEKDLKNIEDYNNDPINIKNIKAMNDIKRRHILYEMGFTDGNNNVASEIFKKNENIDKLLKSKVLKK